VVDENITKTDWNFLLMMKLMSLSDILKAAKAAHPSCGAFL
jgi:hypothetical protein